MMALGGGSFTAQNKKLPGTYINFVSLTRAKESLFERGVVAMPLELDWGQDGAVFTVSGEEFQNSSRNIFGFEYEHEKMRGLRDLFKGAHTLHAYRINSGGKAVCEFGEARHSGTRGNDIKVVIKQNINNNALFDVQTVLGAAILDTQIAQTASDLADNAFIVWNKQSTLALTASTSLAGGANGVADGAAHQAFIDAIEPYSYNTLGVLSTDETTKKLYSNFCRRMRDEMGVKIQVALYNHAADYEGVINVKNKASTADWPESSIIYWAAGAAAGCEVQRTNMNRIYDGEFEVDAAFTQYQLEEALEKGEFILHRSGQVLRVLDDVNSLTSVTPEKNADFKNNQVIRVLDQIAMDIASIFNSKYIGKIANDEAGRVSLWTDIVMHHEKLQDIKALEGFKDSNVSVEQGATKKSVLVHDTVSIVNAMSQLYMTVMVA